MGSIFFYFAIISLIINVYSQSQNCSAIDAYVRSYVNNSIDSVETIQSAQALFPPYIYQLSSTPLIVLDPVMDDPCNVNGISTDISNKIVLIWESIGNCSNHYKVAVAQQNNAIAVLMAQYTFDVNGELQPLTDDDIVTTIPVRTIAKPDAQNLSTNIASGALISIEFSCNNTANYSDTLCILDDEGNYGYLEGEYQIQSHIIQNGHSVWKKEGYIGYSDDIYIYLHDANGDSDWYWALTLDSTFTKTREIDAICAYNDISHPSLCRSWNVKNLNYKESDEEPFVHYAHLTVTNAQCPNRGSFICLQSKQSNLAGLKGTYLQFHPSVQNYYRVLDDCNTRPGLVNLANGWLGGMMEGWSSYWEIYELNNMQIMAECPIYTNDSYSARQAKETNPLFCKEWWTVMNNTLKLYYDNLLLDDTFSLTEGECIDDKECVQTAAPNTFCMNENSIIHRYLEGEYHKTGVIGPNYGTSEYLATLPYYDDETMDVYVWWNGEIPDKYHLSYLSGYWVISPHSLTEAIQLSTSNSNDVSLYGYCEAMVSNPVDCTAGWSFYFSQAYHYDNTFNIQSGSCADETFNPSTVNWPQYVCVFPHNGSSEFTSDLDSGFYSGGYAIIEDYDDYPIWIKPPNDYWSEKIYLWYDSVFKIWKIGDDLYRELRQLVCTKEHGHLPMDCDEWYEVNNSNLHGNDPVHGVSGYNDQMILELNGMYLYECTADDILMLSPFESTLSAEGEDGGLEKQGDKQNKKAANGWMIVTIIMILLLLLVGICWIISWKRRANKEVYFRNAQTINTDL